MAYHCTIPGFTDITSGSISSEVEPDVNVPTFTSIDVSHSGDLLFDGIAIYDGTFLYDGVGPVSIAGEFACYG